MSFRAASRHRDVSELKVAENRAGENADLRPAGEVTDGDPERGEDQRTGPDDPDQCEPLPGVQPHVLDGSGDQEDDRGEIVDVESIEGQVDGDRRDRSVLGFCRPGARGSA